MVTVNKPTIAGSSRNASLTIPSTTAIPNQTSLDALKRKFQRVNQEIVKQNVLLQEQLARNRQEHHQILQENVRLKGRIVALEGKLREAEGVCYETKKSIGDRIEILEAIGEHLIEVTKFLRVLSVDDKEAEEQEEEKAEEKEEEKNSISKEDAKVQPDSKKEDAPKRPLRKHNGSMQSIAEEDYNDDAVFDLTDHIGDVSLKDESTTKNNRKQARRKPPLPPTHSLLPIVLMRKPVSFFLVEYEALDSIGYLLAFLSFTPPFLVAIQTSVYFTLLITAHTLRSKGCQRAALIAGKTLLGQLLNEVANLVLKNILRHPRPSNLSGYKDYGMPSSHSQFMAFLVAIFPALARHFCRLLKLSTYIEALLIAASFLGTFLIAYGRVYLGYHSVEQVFVGLLIGYIFGTIWRQRMEL